MQPRLPRRDLFERTTTNEQRLPLVAAHNTGGVVRSYDPMHVVAEFSAFGRAWTKSIVIMVSKLACWVGVPRTLGVCQVGHSATLQFGFS